MFASWWLAGKAMEPIYQSYQQIQQFTADAAHELRTPLAAILATVESSLMLPILTEKDKESIFNALCQSVDGNPEEYRRQGQTLLACAIGMKSQFHPDFIFGNYSNSLSINILYTYLR